MRDKIFNMQLKRAECPVKVAEIVEKTIRAVYPHYYPPGAVQFFLDLHNEQRVREALAREDTSVTIQWKRRQVERVFPAHHSLDIQPEIIGRMRDAFQGLKESGKLRHGSGTFDYGDWAVWL